MKVLFAAVLLAIAIPIARADGISDTNNTTDSISVGVNEGAGEVFTCTNLLALDNFFCVDTDNFTCYGVSNCAALGVEVAIEIENGTFVFPTDQPPSNVPEPTSLALASLGCAAIALRRRLKA